MTLNEFDSYCRSLTATTFVVQWGEAHVWKVGAKVFAIGGWNANNTLGITFKTSPLSYEILREQPGLRPAPYLASRGLKWIQHYDKPGLANDDLKYYLQQSYRLVALGLSKKKRMELAIQLD
jgi:predicted DNA-binding protein (MmcQ/YjbR family)